MPSLLMDYNSSNAEICREPGMAPPPGTVPLERLLDFAIQKTYHDLTVLAETLKHKTDMERKEDIYVYVCKTGQLFTRLLAIIKWAQRELPIVRKTFDMMTYLDEQSFHFISTADDLARMSREELANARLPNLHMPSAAQILTTGTFSGLPRCIKESIIPEEPLVDEAISDTLLKLNKVVQNKLVSKDLIPQMRNLTIDNGCVFFRIKNEFEIVMTVLDDCEDSQWRLLRLNILVDDPDIGEGRPLVHPFQINYMLEMLQWRTAQSETPLEETFYFLHSFCQSLQLEVLYSQTQKLIMEKLNNLIELKDYSPGKSLTIRYWCELVEPKLGFHMVIGVDEEKPEETLSIYHSPPLGLDEIKIARCLLDNNRLCVENVLIQTLVSRIEKRLRELGQEIKSNLDYCEYTIEGYPPELCVSALNSSRDSEKLIISVDSYSGKFNCWVPGYGSIPILGILREKLNNVSSPANVIEIIINLRYWLFMKRCCYAVAELPVDMCENFPYPDLENNFGTRCFYARFRNSKFILVISPSDDSENVEISCEYRLIQIDKLESEIKNADVWVREFLVNRITGPVIMNCDENVSQKPLKINNLGENRNVAECMEVDGDECKNIAMDISPSPNENVYNLSKNKSNLDEKISRAPKKINNICRKTVVEYAEVDEERKNEENKLFVFSQAPNRDNETPINLFDEGDDEAHNLASAPADIIAFCHQLIPFVIMRNKLDRCGLVHSGVQIDKESGNFFINLISIPPPYGISRSSNLWKNFSKRLISTRIFTKPESWVLEIAIFGNLVAKKKKRWCVKFEHNFLSDNFDKFIRSLRGNWEEVTYLYRLVEMFYTRKKKITYAKIEKFDYRELALVYGKTLNFSARINWNSIEKSFNINFFSADAFNPHILTKNALERFLTRKKDIMEFILILERTENPLRSILKLPRCPFLSIISSTPQLPALAFSVIALTPTKIHLIFMNIYRLEISFQRDNRVTILDAACSKYDRSTPIIADKFFPSYEATSSLKPFLSVYEDNSRFPTESNILRENENHISAESADILSNKNAISPQSPLKITTTVVSPLKIIISSSRCPSDAVICSPQKGEIAPTKQWAGATPTWMTRDNFDKLCTPNGSEVPPLCPLSRFLSCILLRKHLRKFVNDDPAFVLTDLQPGVVSFKVQNLLCLILLDNNNYQSLGIKIDKMPGSADSWQNEDLEILEMFFRQRVSRSPFKPHNLLGFIRMLSSPFKILKDIVELIKMELFPALVMRQPASWEVQFCFTTTISSTYNSSLPVGRLAFFLVKNVALFYLNMKWIGARGEGVEPFMMLPVTYELINNKTVIAEKMTLTNPLISRAVQHVRKFSENFRVGGRDECSIYPAIRDLIDNFVLSEPPVEKSKEGDGKSVIEKMEVDEKSVTEEMEVSISEDSGSVSEVKTNISEAKTNVSEVETNVLEVKPNISEVITNISEVKTNISVVKPNISEVKTSVSEVKMNISEVKTNIWDANTNVLEVKTNDNKPGD